LIKLGMGGNMGGEAGYCGLWIMAKAGTNIG